MRSAALSTLSEELDEFVTADHFNSDMCLDELEEANPAAQIEEYVPESELEGYGSGCICGHCIELHTDSEEEDEDEDDDELMPDLVED